MLNLTQAKPGDTVQIECFSGLATGGPEVIKSIETRYDNRTGKPYKVIITNTDHEFGMDGNAITPPTAYYISELRPKT